MQKIFIKILLVIFSFQLVNISPAYAMNAMASSNSYQIQAQAHGSPSSPNGNPYNIPAILCAVAAGATTIWALRENYLKNKLIASQKDEAKDKLALSQAIEHLHKIKESFGDLKPENEIKLFEIERLLEYHAIKISKTNLDYLSFTVVDRFIKLVEQLIKSNISINLQLKSRADLAKSKNIILNNSQDLINDLNKTEIYLAKLKAAFVQLKPIIELKHFIGEHKDSQSWLEEARITSDLESTESGQSNKKVMLEIESLANKLNLNYQSDSNFALINYVILRRSEQNKLLELINSVKHIEKDSKDLITVAQARYKALSTITNFVSNNERYKELVNIKREFDLKKERQQFEIEQARAVTEREMLKIKTYAQAEKNKEAELQNKKLKLEKKRLNSVLKLEEIRSGKVVQDAIEKNNITWNRKLDEYKLEKASLISQVQQLRAELDKLRLNKGTSSIEESKLKQRIKDLEFKIERTQQLATALQSIIESSEYSGYNFMQIKKYASNIYQSLISKF